MGAEFFANGMVRLNAGLESDEGDEGLAFEFVGTSDHGGFGDFRIADERAFDFGGADAVTGDVEHVIDAADNPEVAVLVLSAAVAGEIASFEFAPIDFAKTLRVAPDAAEHAGPWFANDEFAAGVARGGISFVIDHLRQDAEKRERGAARFGGCGA